MRVPPILSAILILATTSLHAQGWDPAKQAKGWSRMDKDYSCTFHDPTSQKLLIGWVKDAGAAAEVETKALPLPPEKWVTDAYMNAWVISGNTLTFLDKSGKTGPTLKLPYEVGDICWDPKGFVLSYKTATPFLEKRDYKSGAVLWSFPAKPRDLMSSGSVLHRVAVNDDGHVVMSTGDSLFANILDGKDGKPVGQSVFTWNDKEPPVLVLGHGHRSSIAWWSGHRSLMVSVPASQVPATGMNGLLLVKQDMTTSSMTFIPTGLSEDHTFIGLQDTEAVFVAPTGGLVYLPLPIK